MIFFVMNTGVMLVTLSTKHVDRHQTEVCGFTPWNTAQPDSQRMMAQFNNSLTFGICVTSYKRHNVSHHWEIIFFFSSHKCHNVWNHWQIIWLFLNGLFRHLSTMVFQITGYSSVFSTAQHCKCWWHLSDCIQALVMVFQIIGKSSGFF